MVRHLIEERVWAKTDTKNRFTQKFIATSKYYLIGYLTLLKQKFDLKSKKEIAKKIISNTF